MSCGTQAGVRVKPAPRLSLPVSGSLLPSQLWSPPPPSSPDPSLSHHPTPPPTLLSSPASPSSPFQHLPFGQPLQQNLFCGSLAQSHLPGVLPWPWPAGSGGGSSSSSRKRA